MSIAPPDFRRVLGCFATGVTVVTSRIGQRTHGITVNSFTSVSLEPPLVLICLDHKTRAYEFLPEAGVFAVNVLSEEQEEVCRYFAWRLAPDPDDELATIPYRNGITGSPLIEGAIAYVDCRIVGQYEAGDHAIFLGEVVDAALLRDAPPLLFFKGQFPRLAAPDGQR